MRGLVGEATQQTGAVHGFAWVHVAWRYFQGGAILMWLALYWCGSSFGGPD